MSELGARCHIGKYSKINDSQLSTCVTVGSRTKLRRVSVGRYSYIANQTHLNNVEIGSFCSISQRVMNHLGNHPTRTFVSTHPAFYALNSPTPTFADKETFSDYGEKVTIGHDVWIGSEVLLMDGIKIGNGAIVAARSVVTHDVPPYAIIGGIPARLIRYRFDEKTIQRLEDFQWWNKGLDWMKSNVDSFQDISIFARLMGE
jgi:acetyltransferase-like isoleucine patch superfamily enzyme